MDDQWRNADTGELSFREGNDRVRAVPLSHGETGGMSAPMIPRETIAADDITGSNECPRWMRITATWSMDFQHRSAYLSGSFWRDQFTEEEKAPVNRKHNEKSLWFIINGTRIVASYRDAARLLHIGQNAISVAKHRTLEANPNATESVVLGVRFGW
jgi:hypothetical protein